MLKRLILVIRFSIGLIIGIIVITLATLIFCPALYILTGHARFDAFIDFVNAISFDLVTSPTGYTPEQKRWIEDNGEKEQYFKSQKSKNV